MIIVQFERCNMKQRKSLQKALQGTDNKEALEIQRISRGRTIIIKINTNFIHIVGIIIAFDFAWPGTVRYEDLH